MSIGQTVVLMPGFNDTGAQTTALKTALADVAQVLTPDITGSATSTVILEDPALTVLGALSAAGADEFATPPRFIHAGRMRDYLKWHDAYDDPNSDAPF
jgi:hypothetical protein